MTKTAQACSKPAVVDAASIRECLLRLAAGRSEGATFCPSEAARQLSRDWRPLMPPVREAAAVLAARGAIRLARPAKS